MATTLREPTHPLGLSGTSGVIDRRSMASTPRFFSTPLRYLHWASIEKPAIVYSVVIGSLGPVVALAAPPIRARLGDGPREMIPLTYPSERSGLSASAVLMRASSPSWPATDSPGLR